MAKLVFALNQSLDGYVDHQAFGPRPELFQHFVDDMRGLAGLGDDEMWGRFAPAPPQDDEAASLAAITNAAQASMSAPRPLKPVP